MFVLNKYIPENGYNYIPAVNQIYQTTEEVTFGYLCLFPISLFIILYFHQSDPKRLLYKSMQTFTRTCNKKYFLHILFCDFLLF